MKYFLLQYSVALNNIVLYLLNTLTEMVLRSFYNTLQVGLTGLTCHIIKDTLTGKRPRLSIAQEMMENPTFEGRPLKSIEKPLVHSTNRLRLKKKKKKEHTKERKKKNLEKKKGYAKFYKQRKVMNENKQTESYAQVL